MSDETSKPLDFENLSPAEAAAVRKALDSVSEVIEITSPDGLLLFVNRCFEEVTGYSSEEALGRTPKELLRSDAHDAALYGAIWDTISARTTWQGEFEGLRRDGSRYPQRVSVFPVEHGGAIEHYLAIKQPIHEQQIKRALPLANSTTQRQELAAVRERLRVANADLVATSSMAVVGQLAAAMGHEINNPAQVLRSCLEYLQEGRNQLATSEVREVLEDALLALGRIETVTRELVPFSSSAVDQAHPIDINSCVRQGLRTAGTELRYLSKIEDALGEPLIVDGSEARLSRLITGLLVSVARNLVEDCDSNLITISSEGTDRHVRVFLRCQVKANDNFFPELDQLLSNWEGAQSPASSRWISIILCQQIAVAHGGTLAVRNVSDAGGEVLLELPRSAQQELARKRILVIDDEELILRSLKRMLQPYYDVDSSTSGRDALGKIDSVEYDAILCDIMMPGMSGVALFEELEALGSTAGERMIFISAGAFTGKTQRFVETTTQPFVGKPIRQNELRVAIENLLADTSGH